MIFKSGVTGEVKDHIRNTILQMIDKVDEITVFTDASVVENVPKKDDVLRKCSLTGEATIFIKLIKRGRRFISEGDERIDNEG